MSTTAYQQAVERDTARRVLGLPGIEKLSPRDFKVCEACGGPAMQHPRFELAQNIAGGREILCCFCLHQATGQERRATRGPFRIGDQLWRCSECDLDRAWGLLVPYDREFVPALECIRCQSSTRHRYLRVA